MVTRGITESGNATHKLRRLINNFPDDQMAGRDLSRAAGATRRASVKDRPKTSLRATAEERQSDRISIECYLKRYCPIVQYNSL